MGAMNALLGIMQMGQAASHGSNAKEINGQTQNGNNATVRNGSTMSNGRNEGQHGYVDSDEDVSKRIIRNYKLNEKVGGDLQAVGAPGTPGYQQAMKAREAQAQNKARMIGNKVEEYGDRAAGEQLAVKKEAAAGGILSLATGAQQLIGGGLNIAAAKELEKAAAALKRAEDAAVPLVAAPGGDPLDNLNNSSGNNTITGTGQSSQASAADTPASDVPGDLGRGFNPFAPKTDLNGKAPEAAKFIPGGPGAGQNGGGAGISGGIGTSAANGSSEDPKPQQAANNTNVGYDTSGGSYRGGGSGGGAGGDKGPDLSGLLAQFLPKQNEDQANPNGILDFGGRGPAGQGEGAYLDRNANIFGRIHDTYQGKQRSRDVGI
jgi:hypothetical protein